MNPSRLFARRCDSSLTIISQQSASNLSAVSSIGQRLETIEKALQPAVCVQKPSVASQTTSTFWEAPTMSNFPMRPLPCLRGSSADATMDQEDYIFPMRPLGSRTGSYSSALDRSAIRLSRFETLPTFRPQGYTAHRGTPTLLTYCNHEIYSTEHIRVSQFGMFYSRGPGQWTRFTIRITRSPESRYWDLDTVKCFGLVVVGGVSHTLPARLTSMLENSLACGPNLEQDSYLSVYLGNDFERGEVQRTSTLPVQRSRPSSEIKAYLQEVTSMVEHLNCPRYADRQLFQLPLTRPRPTNLFIAYLEKRWVLASRFGSDKQQIQSDVYILQALHCLRGAPGINPFIGVALDEDTGIITAFLSELPAKGRLSRIMAEANNSGHPVSWQRREAWCRQIVEGVAEMHSKGFVIGSLGEEPDAGVAIDASDNAVLYGRFQKAFRYDTDRPGRLPPEYRPSANTGDLIEASPQIDIYQLGLLLWRIAANRNSGLRQWFCQRAGCTATAACTKRHADPIQLPSPGEHVPQYLLEIIGACRAEVAKDRKPAWALLDMFPSKTEATASSKKGLERGMPHITGLEDTFIRGETFTALRSLQPSPPRGPPVEQASHYLVRPEDCLEKYNYLVTCDRCDKETSRHYFHCGTCVSADYYLCPMCFSRGLHCLDKYHQLREVSESSVEVRYHTSVRDNGQRDMVVL